MKKITSFVTKILFVITGCLMFSSFSPSLDGRAVVVDDGVFPKGLFAKTVGYLPGDIISVASISGDGAVDILVIGALDPSEGVAIMLSPEAAAAVGIEKSANNIVKITKRSGQDERVYGSAVIAKKNPLVKDFSEEEVQELEETFINEQEEDFVPETEETNDVIDNLNVENIIETEKQMIEDSPTENTPIEEESITDDQLIVDEDVFEEPEEETIVEEITDEYETIEPINLSDEDIENEVENMIDESEPLSEVEPIAEQVIESDVVNETVVEIEEPLQEESVEAEPFEEIKEESQIVEETPEEIEEPLEQESIESDVLDDLVEEFEVYEEETIETVEDISEESTEEISESYDAIILVPSESNPPIEDEVEVVSQDVTFEDNDIEEVTEVTETSKIVTSYEKYLVKGLADLQSGCYYIQIASLSNDDNIMEIINKYGNNYPITIVPMSSGIRKQVMIGPLSMDEYAVVQERFKSYGYKDAFLRKIK